MKVTVFKRGKRPPEDFDAKKLPPALVLKAPKG